MFPSIRRLLPSLLSLVMATSAGALSVGTFNIRQDNPGDVAKGNGWTLRAPVIAQMIRFHEFDIVGTQEGFRHQINDLQGMMPEYAWTGCGRDDGKENGEHIAIFYRKDLFTEKESGHFWLSETPEKPGRGWDAAMPRICAWTKLEEKASGKVLFFFSVHFDHRGKEARRQGASLIVRMIGKIAGDQPAVLTGDFNVDQTSDSYRVLHEQDGLLKDAFETAPIRLASTGTPNNFDPASRSESRIDHVFLTKHFKASRYGVLTDTYRTPKPEGSAEGGSSQFPSEVILKQYDARVPSDHFPVLVEVDF